MTRRSARFDRMRAVEREYLAASIAAEVLEERVGTDPGFLVAWGIRPRDTRNSRKHLEGTYLIRLFAEFEAGLREAWRDALGQTTVPRMSDLLQGFAARRLIPHDWLVGADSVRESRNALVHEGRPGSTVLSLTESTQHLNRFL